VDNRGPVADLLLSFYLVVQRGFFTSLHSIKRHLKHSTNFEFAEKVRRSNVVKLEFELCRIPNRRVICEPLLFCVLPGDIQYAHHRCAGDVHFTRTLCCTSHPSRDFATRRHLLQVRRLC